MNKTLRRCGVSLAIASLLVACGGGSDDDDYSRVVNFGDSLSDAGTYAVTEVAASGGGRFTINGPGVQLWTDLLADEVGVAAPCPAEKGLNSDPAFLTPVMPPVPQPDCYSYAQGGSRVTEPIGPNNRALQSLGNPTGALGHLTVPLVTQVSRHLAKGNGRFGDDELVTVLAGGNDLFINLAAVDAAAMQPGATQQSVDAAVQAALVAMGNAGAQLATLIEEQMVAKGAERVVLVNLPDASLTPSARQESPQTQALIRQMTTTFNTQLQAGVNGVNEVLVVDAFAQSQDQAANPGRYELDNVSDGACTSSLGSWNCTQATLIAGDTSRYLFADDVHPTPYGHFLIADAVLTALARRGWL
ncbi:MAG: GDSL family lipase [Methylibium sp.]|nr:GDSL family lipase [Methylibium sp.]